MVILLPLLELLIPRTMYLPSESVHLNSSFKVYRLSLKMSGKPCFIVKCVESMTVRLQSVTVRQ